MRRLRGARQLWICLCFGACCGCAQAPAQQQGASESLTVERIYSEPSLSGHPISGIAWAPDSRQISFFKEIAPQDRSKASKELWAMDVASGEAHLLIADKLESVLAEPAARRRRLVWDVMPLRLTNGRPRATPCCFRARPTSPGSI